MNAPIMLSIRFDDDAPTPSTLSDFLSQNMDSLDESERAELSDLGVGGYMIFGGGASPVVRVERVS